MNDAESRKYRCFSVKVRICHIFYLIVTSLYWMPTGCLRSQSLSSKEISNAKVKVKVGFAAMGAILNGLSSNFV